MLPPILVSKTRGLCIWSETLGRFADWWQQVSGPYARWRLAVVARSEESQWLESISNHWAAMLGDGVLNHLVIRTVRADTLSIRSSRATNMAWGGRLQRPILRNAKPFPRDWLPEPHCFNKHLERLAFASQNLSSMPSIPHSIGQLFQFFLIAGEIEREFLDSRHGQDNQIV